MARILLVDDPPGAALAAVEALGIDLALAQTRGRHQIDTVASVVEARRRSAAERYDLVLLHPERLTGGPDGDEVLRETFDVFEDGLCLVSPQGALEIANARGARLYRGPMQSELREAAGEAITRGAAADRGMSQEGRAFVVRAFPLPGRGAILYVRDATDERERELGRLQAEKLASIGLLAAGVAHEINNPAAFVLANIDALGGHLRLIEERLRDPEAEGTRAALPNLLFEANVILQESKEGMARIHRIVRDLGSFSHSDEEASAPMNVNAAIDSALGMLRNELKYRARVERELGAGRLVRASAARLGQVFLNLILNAAQALDEADAKRNVVTVRSFDEGPDVVVEIADNGPGIAAEILPRIFESFFTTKPRGMGTGLGLPISLGIVRTLGGEIVVDSRPGQGATFRVRLPADESAPERTSTSTPAPVPARGYPRRRLLAIDDEALLLKAYRRMLGDAHELTCALGGVEALRLLERDAAFDAILCDLQMPEMSGMEVHAAVRERYPALAERFIFVTGGAFSSDARRFLEEAVSAVIQKPFRLEDMMALIDRTARGAGGPAPSDPGRPATRLS
ncbi:MAG TPA: ATP-binding protein [Polyangia bacterium]|nr:ATP-binding protein [Polyangia bacterium]